VADAGLLAGMLVAGAGRVRDDDGLAGALVETFVATELERQAPRRSARQSTSLLVATRGR
jgi:hypothetical protein